MTRSLRSILLGAALAACALSASALEPTRVGDLPAGTVPPQVPADDVVTPYGYFATQCVVELAEGETVLPDGAVLRADGLRRTPLACTAPHYSPAGQAVAPDTPVSPDFDGWVAFSGSTGSSPPASRMVTTWKVPAAPGASSGQTLYFFPGLEDRMHVTSILQPVLAWNGFADNAWSLTNWNCCVQGTTYHGSTIAVATGDSLTGVMTGGKCSTSTGICNNWRLVGTDTTTGQSTTFRTTAHGQTFDWYFGGVMEVYGVNSCTQYPADGQVAFGGIRIADLSHQAVSPTWSTTVTVSAPACGYKVQTSPATTVLSFSTN